MNHLQKTTALFLLAFLNIAAADDEVADNRFRLIDVFELEYASDPQISPDGKQVVYVRNFMDIMKDRRRSNLWIVNVNDKSQRPITTGKRNDHSPRWSPDGTRLLYVSTDNDEKSQVFCRWMDTGQTAMLTHLTSSPSGLVWSPDGSQIAFSMHVPDNPKPLVELPKKPEGAEWAEPAKVIRKVRYRRDGSGYLKDGFSHLFVLPAEGGTARQLTSGDFHHSGPPAWSADGNSLVFSANRHEDWEYDPKNSEIYNVSLADRKITALTDRDGPDHSPVVSPDGKRIAYLGYDDKLQGYQVTRLYVMNRDGSGKRVLTAGFDRSVFSAAWARSVDDTVYVQFDEHGVGKIALVPLDGDVKPFAKNIGGTTIGRPYSSGSYSLSDELTIAVTTTRPGYPADVGLTQANQPEIERITHLNRDVFGHKELAEVEEIWYQSSFDKRRIQGWIAKPPGFDPKKKYPLILEIHGGPFANYGPRFSAEVQLYAAAGYVVLYANPRGSTSYGQEFGNLIHHAYPGHDYDDLMSGVDAVIQRGYVDEENLFVTGGSGGGVLTAWIVGKTDRFRAAVSAKPVINWYSFALTSDAYPFFYKYWFPGFPWEHPEHYMKRSPLSLAGNVATPTMLLTGEVDYRTPISESEQFYQALKLRKIDTALVRIPGASHGIAQRPSNLIAKVAHILKWFEMHKKQ